MHGLVFNNVSHSYDGVPAVTDLNLQIAPGEIVCLLGPSGCGKSTALRLAAGLEELQAGHIEIEGQRVACAERGVQRPPESRGIGLMFQDYALFPHLKVHENIAFGLRDLDRESRRQHVDAALADVGLADVVERFPHTLSGGQQQRIALLRALAPRPRVMLLDEPFSGLDQYMRQQVRQETLKVLKDAGAATLMVTHDPEEALYLADRVVIMRAGRVVQDSPPIDLYEQPGDAFVARLFGSTNEFHAEVTSGRVVTPLGQFAVDDLPDGQRALVIVRATDIELADGAGVGAGVARFTVDSARPLGALSELVLQNDAARIQARLPGTPRFQVGDEVTASVVKMRAFVFAD
ncbi:MAG: ABC transporter ATP-binding protein [Pseudomonadota bacterium]